MRSVDYKKASVYVFFLALLVRAVYLNIPFVEPYNSITRQTVVGMVVRNFFQHGFNFFYPELDDNGTGPYLFNAEMPIYSYLMAIAYKLAGGAREWAARAVSVLFSMGTLWVFHRFVRRTSDEKTAFFALLFLSFCPLNVALSRSIQPDATMLFASVGALYAFYRYQETNKAGYYWASVLLMALAVAVKAYVLYLFLPIFFWSWHKNRARTLKDPKSYLYLILSCLPLAWYGAMWFLGKSQSLAYSTISYIHHRGELYHSAWDILSPSYLHKTLNIFALHILTPAAIPFFLLGFFKRDAESAERLFRAWFVSVFLFMLVFWRTAIDHSYYQLPFAPVVAFYVARGIIHCLESAALKRVVTHPLFLLSAGVITGMTLLHFYTRLYFIPQELQAVVEAGKRAEQITPKESLVIGSYESSPAQLYYCNRKGWVLDIRDKNEQRLIERLETLRSKGASYFVVSDMKSLAASQIFTAYLKSRYQIAAETPHYLIFKLT